MTSSSGERSSAPSGVRRRRTLSAPSALLDGIGLHSGKPSSVRLLPALAGTGRVFRDRDTGQEISALARNVINSERCTVLGVGEYRLSTVEHVLSALAGLGVDDVTIETTGEELPAADGSAEPFVDLVECAGIAELDADTTPLRPERPLMVSGSKGECIVLCPADEFEAVVVLDYPNHPFIGTQVAEADGNGYRSQISRARTFGFISELELLRKHGLGLGASRENAIALREDGYDTELRYGNELARHKLLDLIGDLSLAGRPLLARVIAIKPGHSLNVQMASQLV